MIPAVPLLHFVGSERELLTLPGFLGNLVQVIFHGLMLRVSGLAMCTPKRLNP